MEAHRAFTCLQMEAVLGSTVLGSMGPDHLCTPSPQRKSILSRNQGYSGKENNPGTPPSHAVTTTPISRLGSESAAAAAAAGASSSLSPTKTTPLLGYEEKRESLRYTSLSELVIAIPNSSFCRSESFGTSSPLPQQPRTPMKDALVEKAVRAYLQPSESFNTRRMSSGWGMCLVIHEFLPSFMTRFSFAIPNPIQFFCCAIHAFTMYMTKESMPLPLYLSPTTSPNRPELISVFRLNPSASQRRAPRNSISTTTCSTIYYSGIEVETLR